MVKEQKFVTMDIDVLREQFDSFDKDGSGYLEAGEAVAALTAIGSKLSFADLDSDGDNKISFEEFSVFSQLVGKHTHPIFKKASKNIGDTASQTGISVFAGNAHLNKAFMQTASKAWRKLAATRQFDSKSLQKAFRAIDIDGDGYLDTGEVRLAIKNIAPQITEMEITLMLATSDTDSDGKITYEEWQRLMMHGNESGAGDKNYWEVYGDRDMKTGVVKDRGFGGDGTKGKYK